MSDLTLKIGQTTLAEAERRLILATIDACKGDKVTAAATLGIGLTTIYDKLKIYRKGIAKSETGAVK